MTTLVAQEQSRSLDGAEKVAAVLLALDREASQRILKHFDGEELRQIARLAAGLGAVPAAALEEIYSDLIDEISHGGADLVGNVTQAETLLNGVISEEQVADIMSDVRGVSNQFFWRRVSSLPEKTLANYLVSEHPQVVAIVISKIEPAYAARLLGYIPGMLRAKVMRRMVISRPVAEAVLRVVEATLQEDLFAASSAPSSAEVNARVAGIMNQLERDQVDEILQGISENEPLIAAQLKSLIFSFEDIVKLGQRARTILFDQLPTERVILALRGADAGVRDSVLPCLSTRTRRMVEAELSSDASPPKKDIAAAQRQVADMVLRLAEQGLIEMPSASGMASQSE